MTSFILYQTFKKIARADLETQNLPARSATTLQADLPAVVTRPHRCQSASGGQRCRRVIHNLKFEA